MSNTTGNDRISMTPWNSDPSIKLGFAVPGSETTFYTGQFLGRDASGNLVQGDDTAKYELLGIMTDTTRPVVGTSITAGDFPVYIKRPLMYIALISSAAAGDEGKKVFVKYNNEVQYTGGSYANFAGHVFRVIDATHVQVLAPWAGHATEGADKGLYSAAAAADTTLTKFAVNQTVLLPLTTSVNVYLPLASKTSPSDRITLINTSANTSTPTILPSLAGSDTINGTSSYSMSSAQYSHVVLRSDGSSKWYVEVPGPSGTVGATTFSGNVALSSATLTVTSTSASAVTAGANGATNPVLKVDASASSVATGLKVTGAAAASGADLTVISSGTNENLTINAKGSGTITLNPTGTGNVVFSRAATGVSLAVTAGLTSSGATGAGIGYATGAGGAVTQGTSRSTGVTLSKLTGTITTDTTSLAAGAEAEFTVTNTTVAATDTVIVSLASGSTGVGTCVPYVSAVGSGSFKITISNQHASTAETGACVLNFAVIKAVAS
jgi:hypothetical protein